MFTTHGHHINGTDYLGVDLPETQVQSCGGPGNCGDCEAETMRALGENTDPAVFQPYVAIIAEKTEELIRLIVGAYQNSRERSLAITNIQQGELWLSKCKPNDPARTSDSPYHNRSSCGGPGICLPCSTEKTKVSQGDITGRS